MGLASVVASGLIVTPGLWTSAQAAPTASTTAAAQPMQANPQHVPQQRTFEVFTTMRDGTKLAANVFLPAGEGPWPVLLTRTPYLKDGAMFDRPAYLKTWTDAGYAFVVQDVRGKGHSQGFFDPWANDIEDGYDTVESLAKEPWSNGKIGMTGASAMGIAATLAAIAQPPHLKAAYVMVAPNEIFRTWFLGGVPESDLAGWMSKQGVSAKAIAIAQAASTRNVFTDRQGPGGAIKYINIPIWNVGGWYDVFNTGTVENFTTLQNHGAKGARGNQRLTMGPFGHAPLTGDLAYPGEDKLNVESPNEARWFDYWLRGVQNGVMDEPPVDVFIMASARKGAYSPKNHWVHLGDWPPNYREVRFYPTPEKSLTTTAPSVANAKISYRFDPGNPVKSFGGANLGFDPGRGPEDQRQVGKREDYFRFETPPLDHDLTIAGPVTAEVYGATDGPDTDFEAKLVDVYPDGYEALVLDAPIRARYRHGRMPDDVQMMTPNAPEKMVIDLWNTALTFEKGHRIALHITSSDSPRFLVNRNNGDTPDHPLPPRVATNSIYMDQDHPTALVLPVVYPDQIGGK